MIRRHRANAPRAIEPPVSRSLGTRVVSGFVRNRCHVRAELAKGGRGPFEQQCLSIPENFGITWGNPSGALQKKRFREAYILLTSTLVIFYLVFLSQFT